LRLSNVFTWRPADASTVHDPHRSTPSWAAMDGRDGLVAEREVDTDAVRELLAKSHSRLGS
jgi:hypothetical protein